MATVFEIPTKPSQAQQFTITLGTTVYTLTLRWNDAAQAWILNIGDANNVPLLQGLLLVTGVDLLDQFEYIGIGGQFVVQSDNDPFAVPTFVTLGKTGHLYFIPDGSLV